MELPSAWEAHILAKVWFYHAASRPGKHTTYPASWGLFSSLGALNIELPSAWGPHLRFLAHFGASLVRSWAHLGPSWRHIGASWRHIGGSWRHIGSSWLHLGRILAHLGATLAHLGATFRRRSVFAHATFGQQAGKRLQYRAFCVRAASLSAAVVRSTMN